MLGWLKKETGKAQKIWAKFSNKDYRDAYVESYLFASLAEQIQLLRRDRGFTQAQLAKLSGKKQSQISKLEKIDNHEATMTTLLSMASAFDVAIKINFVPFSEVARSAASLSDHAIAPKSFDADTLNEMHTRNFVSAVNYARFIKTGTIGYDAVARMPVGMRRCHLVSDSEMVEKLKIMVRPEWGGADKILVSA
tara:strand:+ start:1026 stop:1607 length:582 start_codon:yes stop_codon:yes gene_type:complete